MQRKVPKSHTATILALLVVVAGAIFAFTQALDQSPENAGSPNMPSRESVVEVDGNKKNYQLTPDMTSSMIQNPATNLQSAGGIGAYQHYDGRSHITQPRGN